MIEYYCISFKNGGWMYTDLAGNVIRDVDLGRDYQREPTPDWQITGITRRLHSRHAVSLEDAANGADIGHGLIHDIDHGTRRMWASPTGRRAVKVEKRYGNP